MSGLAPRAYGTGSNWQWLPHGARLSEKGPYAFSPPERQQGTAEVSCIGCHKSVKDVEAQYAIAEAYAIFARGLRERNRLKSSIDDAPRAAVGASDDPLLAGDGVEEDDKDGNSLSRLAGRSSFKEALDRADGLPVDVDKHDAQERSTFGALGGKQSGGWMRMGAMSSVDGLGRITAYSASLGSFARVASRASASILRSVAGEVGAARLPSSSVTHTQGSGLPRPGTAATGGTRVGGTASSAVGSMSAGSAGPGGAWRGGGAGGDEGQVLRVAIVEGVAPGQRLDEAIARQDPLPPRPPTFVGPGGLGALRRARTVGAGTAAGAAGGGGGGGGGGGWGGAGPGSLGSASGVGRSGGLVVDAADLRRWALSLRCRDGVPLPVLSQQRLALALGRAGFSGLITQVATTNAQHRLTDKVFARESRGLLLQGLYYPAGLVSFFRWPARPVLMFPSLPLLILSPPHSPHRTTLCASWTVWASPARPAGRGVGSSAPRTRDRPQTRSPQLPQRAPASTTLRGLPRPRPGSLAGRSRQERQRWDLCGRRRCPPSSAGTSGAMAGGSHTGLRVRRRHRGASRCCCPTPRSRPDTSKHVTSRPQRPQQSRQPQRPPRQLPSAQEPDEVRATRVRSRPCQASLQGGRVCPAAQPSRLSHCSLLRAPRPRRSRGRAGAAATSISTQGLTPSPRVCCVLRSLRPPRSPPQRQAGSAAPPRVQRRGLRRGLRRVQQRGLRRRLRRGLERMTRPLRCRLLLARHLRVRRAAPSRAADGRL